MTTWTIESALNHLYSNSIVTETDCREWQGSRTKNGYGQLSSNSLHKTFGLKGTHRLMIHLVTGHEFAGRHEQVLHSCDNPCCIEPKHLRIGTAHENMQDCLAKGRHNAPAVRGENHGRAYLTNDQVRTIKAMLRAGIRNKDVAALFNMSAQTVGGIKTGHRWGHID